MKTIFELNIHELSQTLADGSLAKLADSIKNLEKTSALDCSKPEQQTKAVPVVTEAPVMTIPVTAQQNTAISQGQQAPFVQQPISTMPVSTPVPTQQPQMQTQPQVMQQNVLPVTETVYTMEQLALAGMQVCDAGKRNEVVALLTSFGVSALTELAKEQYGAYATKLREMGAKL
ncbi:hypothetical protein [Aminipila terrae]|uniref:Uncharacterized protein n=1 Tax=Aminipila terrae TaxID=2697030 RepID=A0A6P1MLD6_9FIRM|nr:hypothetical protein [Aminipila terrae]QHI72878.1 hypothetical protein Ami3637_11090 [Aminipila terrae]